MLQYCILFINLILKCRSWLYQSPANNLGNAHNTYNSINYWTSYKFIINAYNSIAHMLYRINIFTSIDGCDFISYIQGVPEWLKNISWDDWGLIRKELTSPLEVRFQRYYTCSVGDRNLLDQNFQTSNSSWRKSIPSKISHSQQRIFDDKEVLKKDSDRVARTSLCPLNQCTVGNETLHFKCIVNYLGFQYYHNL